MNKILIGMKLWLSAMQKPGGWLSRRLGVAIVFMQWAGPVAIAAESNDPGVVAVDVRFYSQQSELPGRDVTCMAETSEGMLLLGMQGGMAHYDGAQFVNDPELVPGSVKKLVTGWGDGGGWVALDEGGRIVVGMGRGADTAMGPEEVRTLPGRGYRDVEIGADGRICAVGSKGLTFFGHAEAKPVEVGYPPEFSDQSPYLAAARSNGDYVFAVRGEGLWRLSESKWIRGTVASGDVGDVGDLVATRQGTFWALDNDGVLSCRPGENTWTRYPHGIQGGWPGIPRTLAVSSEGKMWAAVANGGLWYFDGVGPWKRVRQNGAAVDFKITSLLVDSSEQLWVGTQDLGLAQVTIQTLEDRPLSYKGEPVKVRALGEGKDGTWLVGASGAGLLEWKEGTMRPVRESGRGSSDSYCNSLLFNQDGSYWAAGGFGTYPIRDGSLIWGDGFKELFGKGDSPMALCRDKQGRVLAGTRTGHLYALSEGGWELLDAPPPNRNIVELACTPNGDIWMGCYGNGMMKVGKPTAVYGQAEGLRSIFIVSTHVDTAGRLWVGSEGGGLAVLNGTTFFSYGPAQGLDSQTVNQILDDGQGRLWLAGNRGILSLRFSDLEAVLRGEKQRVSPEWLGKNPNTIPAPFPAMAAVKASDGRLAFGTSRGFVLIQPPPLQSWPGGPQVRIEKVMLLGQPVAKNSPLLTLPPEARHFEVFWSAPSLKWAENMTFRYRLKGGDEAWHEVGNARRAVFAELAPGNYVLELAARIGNGPWSEKLTRLNITAVPVFWQNWWFRGSAAFAAAGLAGTSGYLLDRGKRKRLAAKVSQEKAVETERIRIARDLHDHLGGTITEMAVYSQLAQSKLESTSEANEYLERILKSAQSGARALGEIVWATDPAHDTLTSFVSQIAEMVRNSSAHATRTLLPIELPPVPLSAEVRQHLYLALKEALNNLHKHAKATEITLEVDCRQDYLRIVLGDNGCGFEPGAPHSFGSDGLKNMRDRLQQVGGIMTLETQPELGTSLIFAVPLNRLG